MSRRLALLGTWLLATAVATGLSWVAVRQVLTDVVPSPVAAAAAVPPATTPPSPPPAAPTATAATGSNQTVDVVGGSVTVRYGAGTTELVSHLSAPGFTADLRSSGPERVEVRFRSEDHESRVVVDQQGGLPQVRREEDDR